jgi:Ser/Thr protein kinase RdoA (MazF antagonist)
MNHWQEELKQMGVKGQLKEVISDKDGIRVLRVETELGSAILKIFDTPEHRREITNYHLLQTLNIPHLQVLEQTSTALLLEDVLESPLWRLGQKEDLADQQIAQSLAAWYKQLHKKGSDYVREHGKEMYEETSLINHENMIWLREVSQTQNLDFWNVWQEKGAQFQSVLAQLPRTLTYNDFFWTNLVVAHDRQQAMMFDYNLLGKGFVYSDLSNVLSSLSEEAGNAFLEAYGPFDNREEELNRITSPLVGLILAFRREKFPSWGNEPLEQLKSGELATLLQHLQL